ncbi:hypothetical protein [Glycomyces tarimensis]
MSIDDLSAAIESAKAAIEEAAADSGGAIDKAEQLSHRLQSLGAEGKVTEAGRIRTELEGLRSALVALVNAAERIQAQAQALRNTGSAHTGAAPATVPEPRGERGTGAPRKAQRHVQPPPGVPESWSPRTADNAKGSVWQRPGADGNTDMVRVMDGTERYPHGYVRFYNQHGQPVGLDGRPGSRAHTHIPIREDGTFDQPQGWQHDGD